VRSIKRIVPFPLSAQCNLLNNSLQLKFVSTNVIPVSLKFLWEDKGTAKRTSITSTSTVQQGDKTV